APGSLQVSPDIRSSFQSMVDGQPPGAIPPSFYSLVRNELELAPIVTIATRRNTTLLKQTFHPRAGLEVHAQVSKIRSRGVQPLGMGTFARQNNIPTPPLDVPCNARPANNPCDGQWESLDVELPAPVDSRTVAANAGVHYSGSNW